MSIRSVNEFQPLPLRGGEARKDVANEWDTSGQLFNNVFYDDNPDGNGPAWVFFYNGTNDATTTPVSSDERFFTRGILRYGEIGPYDLAIDKTQIMSWFDVLNSPGVPTGFNGRVPSGVQVINASPTEWVAVFNERANIDGTIPGDPNTYGEANWYLRFTSGDKGLTWTYQGLVTQDGVNLGEPFYYLRNSPQGLISYNGKLYFQTQSGNNKRLNLSTTNMASYTAMDGVFSQSGDPDSGDYFTPVGTGFVYGDHYYLVINGSQFFVDYPKERWFSRIPTSALDAWPGTPLPAAETYIHPVGRSFMGVGGHWGADPLVTPGGDVWFALNSWHRSKKNNRTYGDYGTYKNHDEEYGKPPDDPEPLTFDSKSQIIQPMTWPDMFNHWTHTPLPDGATVKLRKGGQYLVDQGGSLGMGTAGTNWVVSHQNRCVTLESAANPGTYIDLPGSGRETTPIVIPSSDPPSGGTDVPEAIEFYVTPAVTANNTGVQNVDLNGEVFQWDYQTPTGLQEMPASGTIRHSTDWPQALTFHRDDASNTSRYPKLSGLTLGDTITIDGNVYTIQDIHAVRILRPPLTARDDLNLTTPFAVLPLRSGLTLKQDYNKQFIPLMYGVGETQKCAIISRRSGQLLLESGTKSHDRGKSFGVWAVEVQ